MLQYFDKYPDVELVPEPVAQWCDVKGHNLLGKLGFLANPDPPTDPHQLVNPPQLLDPPPLVDPHQLVDPILLMYPHTKLEKIQKH